MIESESAEDYIYTYKYYTYLSRDRRFKLQ